jgi:hypothetical protein
MVDPIIRSPGGCRNETQKEDPADTWHWIRHRDGISIVKRKMHGYPISPDPWNEPDGILLRLAQSGGAAGADEEVGSSG